MKKLITIVVTLCLVLQCAVQLGIMGLYELRKEYVVKNLCVNKDKPKLHCNGKCHLRKQLKKTSEQQDKENQSSKEEVVVAVAFVLPVVWQPAYSHPVAAVQHVSSYTAPQGIILPTDIFHPPQKV
jgi:hypothetical protein